MWRLCGWSVCTLPREIHGHRRVIMGMNNQTEILLESGTNELEIMEFTVGGEIFGINVAKVREIMMYCAVKPMQNSHPVIAP